MKILDNIKIVDLGLYFVKEKTLVVGDIHIGLEEAMNKEGIMVPRKGLKKVLEHFNRIFSMADVDIVVINGDMKHEFGEISRQEWQLTLKLLDYLIEKSKKVILIKGNHDKVLGPIAEKREIKVVDSYVVGRVRILHGHKEDKFDEEVLLIGHDHPCVSLRNEVRVEKYKCFLKGKWTNKTLIVLPSFNFVSEGTDIRREKLLSPYLQQDLSKFEVFIVGDDGKIYDFGMLNNF